MRKLFDEKRWNALYSMGKRAEVVVNVWRVLAKNVLAVVPFNLKTPQILDS